MLLVTGIRCRGSKEFQGDWAQFSSADLSKRLSNLSVPQVSVIKVKIHEATGMPAGKQKLQYEVSQMSVVLPLGSQRLSTPSQKLDHLWNQRGEEMWGWPRESVLEATMLTGSARAG